MLKSIYSRIFYTCTVVLIFACAASGLIVMLRAVHIYKQAAYDQFDSTARVMLSRIQELYVQDEQFPQELLRSELTTYTVNYNVDCYIFDADGVCLIRSDYDTADIALSAPLRTEANEKPYCRMGGNDGNFSGPTATYVEHFTLDETRYYLMLIFPVSYVSDFTAQLPIVLAVSVLVIGIIGTVLFYCNTTQLLKPVIQITHAAENYAKGDFSARVAPTGDSDLDYLADTLNRMADFIDRNERSRRSFVSDVSHELKTPMTTIGGFVDGILDGTIPPENQKHYLKIVSSEVHRMTRMVQSMLNISKFEAGTLTPNFTQFDITHLVIKTLLLFEQQIENKQVAVEGLEDCPKAFVTADKDLMQQVFYNLTENAIKFINTGGTLSIAVRSDSEQVHVHLRNTGEGLSEDELPRVFERFYKTDASRGKDTTGVGLGLSIVSRIMVLHGGTVTVKSVQGTYTEFIVSLLKEQPKDTEKHET